MTRVVVRQIRAAVLLVGATVLAACSDVSVAPKELSGPSLLLDVNADVAVTTFTVYPNRGSTYVIGGVHQLKVPAGAICNLTTSSYGPTEWNRWCSLEQQPVKVIAKSWTDSFGHPHIDFSPALRFSPKVTVTLFMKDRKAAADPSFYKIIYCAADGRCVDESRSDSSLLTRSDASNTFLYRRVKHFSGYNIAAGSTIRK